MRDAPARRVDVGGFALEVREVPGDDPALVLLHEGLGSVSHWRAFPDALARATGRRTVAYSRRGHGASDPRPGPRDPDFMHDEARTLDALLDVLGVAAPILVGHSDGGTVALLHAARAGARDRGVVAIAPHVFVETCCVEAIAEVTRRYREDGTLREKLRRHHRDPDHTFFGWSDVWLSPAFRRWNVEAEVAAIEAPVLVVQGRDDPYGTAAQYEAIATGTRGPADVLVLSRCGHAPQRERPALVLETVAGFVRSLLGDAPTAPAR